MNYYSEWEPYAAQYLRNLIAAGLIPAGHVDTRSITDVQPSDLAGYRQCHFFAGIGGWSLATRLVGWPDDRELWTGSAPCQPFSVAGQGKAQADDRHLWPHLFRLARARRPAVIMGEQVAAAVGKDWIDGVFADLEGIGYACGAAVVPACAVDAPHRRDRLWFVAHTERARGGCEVERGEAGWAEAIRSAGGAGGSGAGTVAHADSIAGRQGCEIDRGRYQGGFTQPWAGPWGGSGCSIDVADSNGYGCAPGNSSPEAAGHRRSAESGRGTGGWDKAGWLIGHDGKARRFEPSIRLLAHGVPARVGRLRAYGNAIVPQVAAEVIGAYIDCYPDPAPTS